MNPSVLAFLTLLSPLAHSEPVAFAPPSFEVSGKRAVFVDFTKANYAIFASRPDHQVTVTSEIDFNQTEAGYAIFDLVNLPESVFLDGKEISSEVVRTPGDETKLRILSEPSLSGSHHLTIKSQITDSTRFSIFWSGVFMYFKMRDLDDRQFLEQYLPTNLEYDQYASTIDLDLNLPHPEAQLVYANGVVTRKSSHEWHIEYPSYFTASSLFFHTFQQGRFKVLNTEYTSVDGRKLPVLIYVGWLLNPESFKEKAFQVLKELETDYGPYPHPQVIIYGRGFKGGMEYSGGTETSLISLGHELFHSYFARGIMPANGSAGFIDEALASWRDKGYQKGGKPGFEKSNIGGHTPYTRETDDRCYAYGREFMAYLNGLLLDHGKADGLKGFLRYLLSKRIHQVITTESFEADFESYSKLDVKDDFDHLVLGKFGAGPDPKPTYDDWEPMYIVPPIFMTPPAMSVDF